MFHGTNRRTALALAATATSGDPSARYVARARSHAGEAMTASAWPPTIDAFSGHGLEAVIVNAAGCGSNMKEYQLQLRNDPARRRRRGLSQPSRMPRVLVDKGLRRDAGDRVKVAYQDPCHWPRPASLSQPRQVLR